MVSGKLIKARCRKHRHATTDIQLERAKEAAQPYRINCEPLIEPLSSQGNLIQFLYIAKERFGPSNGTEWTKYIEWSGLSQLTEVVTLDGVLGPVALGETKDSYWPHIVNEDCMLDFFVDLDFLLSELADASEFNILSVIRRPSADVRSVAWGGFTFLGYDLLDQEGATSALTNCGGFPDVFANSELSHVGLIPDFDRAAEIQDMLRRIHPEERHADCDIWAISRWQSDDGLRHAIASG